MPKQVQNVNVAAPGYWGLNTEDSPTELPPSFASVADNCIIDKRGRLASRKGMEYQTTSGGTDSDITSIFEFVEDDGTATVFSTGNNKIYSGTTTLTNETPGGASITADNWQFAQLNEEMFCFQESHAPMMYDPDVGSVELVTNHTGYVGTVPQGDCVLAAFGRLWVGGVSGEKAILYWSDLLNGAAWSGGSSGSIILEEFWPTGQDEIKVVAEHNNFLVVFGGKSILIYQGADNPATMALYDVVAGIGCVARDTVRSTGGDLIFLDRSGLRSLGRTIQEKSQPLGILSKNINTDLKNFVNGETGNIKSLYCRYEAFYLLSFPSQNTVYAFDTRFPLQDGALRVTQWIGRSVTALAVRSDCTVLFGGTDGILSYSADYTDEGGSYPFRYFTHELDFGSPANIKILKEADLAIEGGDDYTISIKWALDFGETFRVAQTTTGSGAAAEYGEAEYNVDEYGSGAGSLLFRHVKIGGTGRKVRLGAETNIDGSVMALQEMNIHAILGRLE